MTVDTLNILPNLRDLGGLPLADGRTTRFGVLYRSALPVVGDAAPTSVIDWPVGTVIDLRSPHEVGGREHPLRSGDTVVHRIALLSDAEISAGGGNLPDIYLGIVANAGDRLARIVRIAATAPGPVLVHCAAGKDRTGVAVALLLSIAGVNRTDIIADYLSTDGHMDAVLARIIRFAPELGTNPHDRDLRGVVPEAIDGILNYWDAYAGGIREWARAHGVTDDTIERWTARLCGSAPVRE